MESKVYEKARQDPKFFELVKKRNKLTWTLSFTLIGVYFLFILVVAFWPELLAAKMGDGVTTIGIPVGICIILLCFGLTGIYVRKANGEFDALEKEIRDSARLDEC